MSEFRDTMKCSNCGTINPMDADYCRNEECQTIIAGFTKCRLCGFGAAESSLMCPNCGVFVPDEGAHQIAGPVSAFVLFVSGMHWCLYVLGFSFD